MAKKKKKAAKKVGKKKRLFAVDPAEYTLYWDADYNACHFGHRSGIGGEIGSGVADVIEVFSNGNRYYVLSLNYAAPYACLETFVDTKGVQSLIFAEPKDMRRLFSEDLPKTSPKQVAEQLASMIER